MKQLVRILALIIILAGCSSRQDDPRLEEINILASENPQQATARLDSIDATVLSRSDRNYYDFLTIKTRDKAFVTHTADSLIKEVLDYTASNDKKLYPEALYYGGRVYSDLGDYPSALSYFQQALDLLEDDKKNLKLKGNVLSQTALIFEKLYLYDDAIINSLEVLNINEQLNDSDRILKDLQIIGSQYFFEHEYKTAENYFKKAALLANEVAPDELADIKVYLAGVKYHLGQYDSALVYIKDAVSKIDQTKINWARSYLADINLISNNIDSAYKYANLLIHCNDPKYQLIGYHVYFSPKLNKLIQGDSIARYANNYAILLEKKFDQNNAINSLLQHSKYNYHKIDEKFKKENFKNKILEIGCIILIILIISITIKYLTLKNSHKKEIYCLKNLIESKGENLTRSRSIKDNINNECAFDCNKTRESDNHSLLLREDLRNNLLLKIESEPNEYVLPEIIWKSQAYKQLLNYIKNGTSLIDSDKLWDRLDSVVLKAFPKFKEHLFILTKGNISDNEYQTALLIKCGISPSQIVKILSITKGAVSSRRNSLCEKIFDEKKGNKIIDSVIRLL